MDKHERIMKLEEAKEHLENAIELIEDAVKKTPDEDACNSYIIAHIKGWAQGSNPLDVTAIPKLIKKLQEWDEIEYPEEE